MNPNHELFTPELCDPNATQVELLGEQKNKNVEKSCGKIHPLPPWSTHYSHNCFQHFYSFLCELTVENLKDLALSQTRKRIHLLLH